ncbi:MAG: protein kinase [Planctomycetes bacterium]|nr:protein kinase [Planctomycetota bacterium]
MSSLDRYRKLEALGEGGTGTVYRAVDSVGGEVVAVKVLHAGLESSNMLQRMAREVRTLRQLNHPGIVRVFDAGVHRGLPFLVMDFVEGETLTQRVHTGGPLGQREAAELVLRMSEALAHAHGRGILHRDLKPDNVLLDHRGRPSVTDFGLALELNDRQRLTRSGALLGTPGFLAPEQAKGDKQRVGPATDVYGLGGVLYYALTGRVPIPGENLAQVVIATVKQRPTPIRELRPDVDPALEAICLRCLEKDPVHRFDSVQHLAAALRDYLEQGAPASGEGRASLLPLGLLALVGVGALGGLAALALRFMRPERPPEVVLPEPRVTLSDAPSAPPPLSPLEQRLETAHRFLHEGRPDKAQQAAAEATALDPDSAEAWILRGEVAFDAGDAEEALAFLERARELVPDDPRVPFHQGRALFELDRLEEAEAAFERSLELREDGGVRLERALLHLECGRRERALEDARLALKGGLPRLQDYGLALEVFDETGARADREAALERLVGLPLQQPEERLVRAELLVYPRPAAALLEVDALLGDALLPEGVLRARGFAVRGQALAWLGRSAEALEPLGRALEQWPDRFDLLHDQALALQRLQRYDEALDVWQRLLDEDPGSPPALANLAYVHLQRGELDAAQELLDQLEGATWIPPEGFGARALLHHLLGNHTAAVSEARDALAGGPALEWPRVVLAKALEALGRRRQALATWREVAEWHRSAEDRALAAERIAGLERADPSK